MVDGLEEAVAAAGVGDGTRGAGRRKVDHRNKGQCGSNGLLRLNISTGASMVN
jgi:hypothetical protein